MVDSAALVAYALVNLAVSWITVISFSKVCLISTNANYSACRTVFHGL